MIIVRVASSCKPVNSTLKFYIPCSFDIGNYNIDITYSRDEDYCGFIEHDLIKVAIASFEYNINSTNLAHFFKLEKTLKQHYMIVWRLINK